MANRLLVQKRARDLTKQAIEAAFSKLTPRERQVLCLLTEGHNTQEIADQLSLSAATVRTYTSYIFDKLQVQNRIQAVNMVLTEVH